MLFLCFCSSLKYDCIVGAPGDNPLRPVPTSYDDDAAISEAGDVTYKYYMIRETIGKVGAYILQLYVCCVFIAVYS